MENIYIGLDGDSIGREIEKLIISNEPKKVREFSNRITFTIESIKDKLIKKGGEIIFFGGDSVLAFGKFKKKDADEVLKYFKKKTSKTASIGMGRTLGETYLGLKLAKANGGNQAINYSKKIKK